MCEVRKSGGIENIPPLLLYDIQYGNSGYFKILYGQEDKRS